MGYPKQPGQDAEAHRALAERNLVLVQENERLRAELASRPPSPAVDALSVSALERVLDDADERWINTKAARAELAALSRRPSPSGLDVDAALIAIYPVWCRTQPRDSWSDMEHIIRAAFDAARARENESST